ncbi:MAG: hypothetical protein IPP17_10250 [Bacteroidetes bacterium]|nr:hypothetical protein [Bacteroidota bacterium]
MSDLLRWRQRDFDHECTFGTYLAAWRTNNDLDHGDDKRQLHRDAQQYFRMHLDVVADRGDGDSVADDPDDYAERTDGTLPRRQRDPYKQQPTGNTWSTGATTQSITVGTVGSYWVRWFDGTCTSDTSALINVVTNPNPPTPTITPNGPTTFCSGDSVILTSSSAVGNTWSTGATTNRSRFLPRQLLGLGQ